MTISVTNIGTNSTKTAAVALAVTVPAGGVPSGALILLCEGNGTSNSGTVGASVVDSASNSYTNGTVSNNGGNCAGSIYRCWNCNALVSTNTISLTANTNMIQLLSAFYATGVKTSSDPLDTQNTASTTGNSGTPSVSTSSNGSANGNLVVGWVVDNGPSGDTGFVQDSTNGAYATPPTRVGTTGAGAASNITGQGGFFVDSGGSGATETYAPAITSRNWAASIQTFLAGATANFTSDNIIITEILQSIAEGSVNLESIATIARDSSVKDEILASLINSQATTLEAMRGVTNDITTREEIIGRINQDSVVPTESLATTLTLTRDGKVYLEILGSVREDSSVRDEIISLLRRDTLVPTESQGAITVTSDGKVNLEFVKSTIRDSSSNLEVRGPTLITIDGKLSLEFLTKLVRDTNPTVEIVGSGTVLTFPTLSNSPSTLLFGIQGSTQTFHYDIPDILAAWPLAGDRWVATVGWDTLTRSDWALLSVFQVLMRGETGRCYFSPPHILAPRGVATGTPTVNGASQNGTTLATIGWTPSITGILKTGDFISFNTPVGRELKVLTADANSDSSGKATLSIAPSIRTSPVNGVSIVTQNPSCIMKFVDDKQGQIKIDPPLLGSVQFEFIEALK